MTKRQMSASNRRYVKSVGPKEVVDNMMKKLQSIDYALTLAEKEIRMPKVMVEHAYRMLKGVK